MASFKEITGQDLIDNHTLYEYLKKANIQTANKGGAFVGNFNRAPQELAMYGIILPKGGMIMPHMHADELASMVQERRAVEHEALLKKIDEIMESLRSLTSSPHIQVKRQTGAMGTYIIIFYGEDEILHGVFEPIRKMEAYLRAEESIWRSRKQLLPRVLAAHQAFMDNAGPGYNLQALEFGREKPDQFMVNTKTVWKFESSHAIGFLTQGGTTGRVFRWEDKDIKTLEGIIYGWIECNQQRLEMISDQLKRTEYKIFYRTKTSREHGGHSHWDGRVREDISIEERFYVGDLELKRVEVDWATKKFPNATVIS